MPTVDLNALQTLTLLGLLLGWAAALFGGYATGRFNEAETHRIPRPLRITSSLLLVLAAWAWWASAPPAALRTLALFVALGMTAGFIGDLFMARYIVRGDGRVLGGLMAFGIGHVLYIAGMLTYGAEQNYDSPARWLALLVWLVLGAVLWFRLIYRTAAQPGTLHRLALPYALLLAGTVGVASGLTFHAAGFGLLALGAALFLASDLLLALEIFNGLHFRGIGDAVWLMYGPGQMLIVYAAIFPSLLG
ncbi:MAG: lysoplasmalogenase family protein [Chloroflexota bacterium]